MMDKLVRSGTGSAIDADIKSRRVMVWRFADAPTPLRSLHCSLPPPEWLVLVPHTLIGSDLDEAITNQRAKSSGVFRYKTPAGDVVYTGNSLMSKAEKHLRTAKAESTAASIPSHA
jgi:hypothetical protein